jgi:hypothetical protein
MTMKNLFAMEIGDLNEENESSYGEADRFVLRRVEADLSEKQDELNGELEAHQKNAELPPWLNIVRMVSLLLFLIVFSATVKAGFSTAMKNAPLLVIAGAISGIAALVLWLIGRSKTKNVIESEDFSEDVAAAEEMRKESLAALAVPEDAVGTDVFMRTYKMKKGKEKRASSFFEYLNNEWLLFREDDMLCFADCGGVIGISVLDITGIYKINKRVSFMCWNKEEEFNKGKYKQYKITCDNVGTMYIKTYYSMRFVYCAEEYEILFPAYELETFKRLTGAPVKEAE